MKSKKWIGLIGTAVLTTIVLAGCGNSSNSSSETSSAKDDNKMITVTVFDSLANYQGTQTGWFAKIVKDKFHMKLNIIAPNVAGGGDTLFDTRSAAGNLGDIVITGSANGRAQKMVKSGLIADMTPYLKDATYIKKYKSATQAFNKIADAKKGVWGIPNQVSTQSPTASSEGNELTYGPYLRWDYYKAVGYPKINSLMNLIPVLKKMQAYARKENPGKKIYALSLFKDWDANMMNNAKQPACFYGYDEMGFVLAKANGQDYQSILSKNGRYVQSLKFFNKAQQEGLVDPESATQNYDTMFSKYVNGLALFSFWPWLGQAAYNTTSNMAAGKGFMLAPLQDMKIFSNGATTNGSNIFIALGSKAKHKQRLVNFINWLYSPEGAYASSAQTGGTAGPKGLTWTLKNKKPVLTAFGRKALLEGGTAKVPAKWGKGSYKDGVSALNYAAILPTDTDPNTHYSYSYALWPSIINENASTALGKDWSSHMGGAKTTIQYLKAHHNILVAPGAGYVAPEDSSEINTLRGQIKTQIVNDSWKMVFAKNDSQFSSILSSMTSTVNGLGYKKVLKVDLKDAKLQNQARLKIKNEFKS